MKEEIKECIIHGDFKDACNNGKPITGPVSEVIENFRGECMYDVSLEMVEKVPLKNKNRYFGNILGSSLKAQIKETAKCALECLGNDGCKYLDKINFSEFGKPNEREKAYLKDFKTRKPAFFEKLRNNIVFNGDEISFFVKGNFSGEKDWITLKKVNLEEKKLLDEDDKYRIPTEKDLLILNNIFGSFSNDNEDFGEFFKIFGIKEEGYGNNFYKFLGKIHFQANDPMLNDRNLKRKKAFLLYVSYV